MQELTWWQRGVIYEIYPRSFQDSNGDGIGDLAGIRQRLDYLVDLGVAALWISPIYPSPMADFGYDIADYCDIDPIFGTLGEFDVLLEDVHRRRLKMILDFVPNHTSDRHPWFLESRSSRDNPKRDWYLWRDQPNNWLSNFGGSAWEHDPSTGQYYYHAFLKQQPDLNWRNPAVRTAMFDVLRFWLDRGVDGFRVDVMWLMIKDDQFRDNPVNPNYKPGTPSINRVLPLYNANRPQVHELVAAMRTLVDSYPDRVLIGEIYLPIQQLMAYYGKDLAGVNLPFNFQLLQCAWSAEAIAQTLSDYYAALPVGAWPNWVLGNHDQPRISSRVGAMQAAVAAMLILTLPGTLTLYYGEEIGMTNVPIAPESVQDPAEKNEPGIGAGRDAERTPMQWDATPLAGFTTGQPWLPIASDHASANVADQHRDPNSMLALYRDLIRLRSAHPTLIDGKMQSIAAHDNVLRYQRVDANETLLILLNLSHEPVHVDVSGIALKSTHGDREGEHIVHSTALRPAEGLILKT
ncbi:MAG: alpha-amylase family glycosyl hydrolase [Acidobacteriota bacterium]|nr:alpha-amylase family glycosyl hydrolase [Acidobacteriota bacterium]